MREERVRVAGDETDSDEEGLLYRIFTAKQGQLKAAKDRKSTGSNPQ